VLYKECCSGEIVVTDEVAYRPDVIVRFLGERQRAVHEPGDPLPQGVVEPLTV